MITLFNVQPESCRQKLDIRRVKNFNTLSEGLKQLVLFDPISVYQRLEKTKDLDPYRRQNSLSMVTMFPNTEAGFCACGCGKELSGRKTRWATKNCSKLPLNVHTIISGHSYTLDICRIIFGTNCVDCGAEESWTKPRHELDHQIPVKFGGGGCWLNNYVFRCKSCHRDKTNKDFKYGKYKTT